LRAGFGEVAGSYEAVAAVVALAAEDYGEEIAGVVGETEPGDGGAGVLHEFGYGDAQGDGLVVGRGHFFGGENVHQDAILAFPRDGDGNGGA